MEEMLYAYIMLITKWGSANCIYQIPKSRPWNWELCNTRLVILLDILRKIFIKIVNTRMIKIFKEHDIFKGPNYAGLSGESTMESIQILMIPLLQLFLNYWQHHPYQN